MKKGTIFVIEVNDGDIIATNRQAIEAEIKYCEERGEELTFKTIAEIKQPPQGISPDFDPILIQFLDKEQEITLEFRHRCALAIINYIL